MLLIMVKIIDIRKIRLILGKILTAEREGIFGISLRLRRHLMVNFLLLILFLIVNDK